MLAAIWIFPKILRIALLKDIVDNPNARKLQRVPIPVLGGVAVMFGILVALIVCRLFFDCSDLFTIMLAMLVMLYIGTIDDIIEISPYLRFLMEIAVAIMLMYTCNYSINDFHGLWGYHFINLKVALPLTVLTVVGLVNAINLIDGVDGYSSGYCIMACFIFGVIFYIAGDVSMVMLASVCAASLIPFFLHNVFGLTSKMFIGDGGTLVMGIVMSIFVLNMLKTDTYCALYESWGMGLVPLSLAVLSIPVFDTIRVMSMRILRGVSPFHPDKTHLHHLFISMGFSHIGATISILLFNLCNILIWYVSYKLGASIDLQLYIVILVSFLSTFGVYGLMRVAQRRRWPLWRFMCRMGRISHIERKGLFLWLQKVMDWKIN
ncbi:MAG: undecaprenyl/decaprenyl-phosphate alpha-N-acetylglucosaminyl 1-phosphate transferase [Bacteroidaceae bacterium]|nr:undecaprenyl/decaprenyl-phosphate alpha-N-acetylglucosaminyl 1-phosphate transferase [Bacteroidaceae bacterium]